jgi:hypothetical protein
MRSLGATLHVFRHERDGFRLWSVNRDPWVPHPPRKSVGSTAPRFPTPGPTELRGDTVNRNPFVRRLHDFRHQSPWATRIARLQAAAGDNDGTTPVFERRVVLARLVQPERTKSSPRSLHSPTHNDWTLE